MAAGRGSCSPILMTVMCKRREVHGVDADSKGESKPSHWTRRCRWESEKLRDIVTTVAAVHIEILHFLALSDSDLKA